MKKKLVMVVTAITLVAQSFPIYADTLEDVTPETSAEIPETSTETPETPTDVVTDFNQEVEELQEEENTAVVEPGSYAEGRAIVYIKDTTSTVSTYAMNEAPYSITDLMEIPSTEEQNQDGVAPYGLGETPIDGKLALVESDTLSTEQLISELEQQPGIEFAEPDYIVTGSSLTNDPYVEKEWMLSGSAGSVDVDYAWNKASVGTGSDDVVVAVLDTGVDYNHEDLADNMWSDPNDPSIHGYNAINNTYDPMDDYMHGTHVAGIIGAIGDNEIGITGINQNIQIMAIKFLSAQNVGYNSDAIKGMNYILQKKREGVPVVAVNNSWGGNDADKGLKVAIEALGEEGIISMNASGNESSNLENVLDEPGGIISENVINVNAIDSDGNLAQFSNYGKTVTNISAPGVNIFSTILTSKGSIYPEETPYVDTLQTFEQDATDVNDWKLQDATEGKDITVSLSVDQIGCQKCDIVENQHSQKINIQNATIGEKAIFVTAPQDLSAYKAVADGFAFNAMVTDSYGSQAGRYLYISFMKQDKTWTKECAAVANYEIFTTAQVKFEDLGEEESQIDWENFQIRIVRNINNEYDESGMEFHFDNFALVDNSNIVAYAYDSGTSMATPVVTGAYALLAGSEEFKDETSQKLRARILGGAIKTDALYDTCTSGGYLSLEKAIENPSPVINEVAQDRNEAKIQGYFFGEEGSVSINGQAVKTSEWSDESVTIQIPEGLVAGNYEVLVERADEESGRIFSWLGYEDESVLYENLEDPNLEALGLSENGVENYELVSYEDKIYRISNGVLNKDGYPVILSYDIQKKDWTVETEFPYMIYYDYSNWIAVGNKLYSYFSILNTSEDQTTSYFTGELVSYDLANGTWDKLQLSEEGLEPTWGRSIVYNGEKVLLAGGYVNNAQDGTVLRYDDTVYSIALETGETTEVGTLSQVRFRPELQMWGDELVVIGGTYEDGFVSEIEQGTVENLKIVANYPEVLENQQYELGTGSSEQGIFCVGMIEDGDNPADTWVYNPDTYQFSKQSVRMGNGKFYNLGAAVNNEYLYTAALSGKTHETVFMRMKIKNTESSILSFTIDKQQAQIDVTNHTITLTVPYGTDVTKLAPEITVSEGASVTPASGETLDFTNPVEYVVTAEDGSTTTYTATVNVQEQSEYLITLSYSEGGTVTLSQMSAAEGTEITITATPNDGYKMDEITVNGKSITGTTFKMPAENVALYVNFEKLTYTITIAVEPSQGGSVDWTSKTVSYGDSVTMKATANSGYTFSKWTENGATVSTAATVTLQNVQKNHDYTAVFVKGTSPTTTPTPTVTPTSTPTTTPTATATPTPTSTSSSTNATKTGDETNLILWVLLLAIGGTGILLFTKRKSVK